MEKHGIDNMSLVELDEYSDKLLKEMKESIDRINAISEELIKRVKK